MLGSGSKTAPSMRRGDTEAQRASLLRLHSTSSYDMQSISQQSSNEDKPLSGSKKARPLRRGQGVGEETLRETLQPASARAGSAMRRPYTPPTALRPRSPLRGQSAGEEGVRGTLVSARAESAGRQNTPPALRPRRRTLDIDLRDNPPLPPPSPASTLTSPASRLRSLPTSSRGFSKRPPKPNPDSKLPSLSP